LKRDQPFIPDELLTISWQLFDDFNEAALVRPSIPITYFGDSHAYARSLVRITTVGLNPSRREFPEADRFLRFPSARPSNGNHGARDPGVHREALDSYFRNRPYMAWFNSYELLLQGIGASYLPNARTSALHTDLCSPLATDPTWNGLSGIQQASLEPGGAHLWHELVVALAPQVIIASVAAHHLAKIAFPKVSEASILTTIERANPFHVYQQRIRVGDTESFLVWGRSANRPFGTVSDIDRRRIGNAVSQLLGNG